MKFIKTIILCFSLGLVLLSCNSKGKENNADNTSKVVFRGQAPSLTIGIPLAMMVHNLDSTQAIPIDLQTNGTSSTISIDAVLGGHATFGSVGALTAMQAIKQGADLKIIAAIVNNVQMMVIHNELQKRLGISPNAPIADRVKGLKGLTIATGAVGSTHYQILRSYLKQYGLDPDKDVKLVGVAEPSALITGFEQRRFDAIAYASPLVEHALAGNLGQTWISGPKGDISGSENIKIGVIIARTETVEKNSKQVDQLLSALNKALETIKNDRVNTGNKIHQKYFPSLERGIWDTAWNATINAYPQNLTFTREAFDYWVQNDPKGAESYKNIDYKNIIYDKAQ